MDVQWLNHNKHQPHHVYITISYLISHCIYSSEQYTNLFPSTISCPLRFSSHTLTRTEFYRLFTCMRYIYIRCYLMNNDHCIHHIPPTCHASIITIVHVVTDRVKTRKSRACIRNIIKITSVYLRPNRHHCYHLRITQLYSNVGMS